MIQCSSTFILTGVFTNVLLSMWDIGGQDNLRPLWRHYYRGASGIIFVVDSTDGDRFEIAQEELHQLTKEVELQGIPSRYYSSYDFTEIGVVCILANKQDKELAHGIEDISKALCLSELGSNYIILPSSGLSGEGLFDGIDWLTSSIL